MGTQKTGLGAQKLKVPGPRAMERLHLAIILLSVPPDAYSWLVKVHKPIFLPVISTNYLVYTECIREIFILHSTPMNLKT